MSGTGAQSSRVDKSCTCASGCCGLTQLVAQNVKARVPDLVANLDRLLGVFPEVFDVIDFVAEALDLQVALLSVERVMGHLHVAVEGHHLPGAVQNFACVTSQEDFVSTRSKNTAFTIVRNPEECAVAQIVDCRPLLLIVEKCVWSPDPASERDVRNLVGF